MFHFGSTGSLLLLGAACLLAGLFRRNQGLVAAGLTILLLKPQYGLPIYIVAAFDRDLRKPTAIAAAATAAMMVPAFVCCAPSDLLPEVRHLISNLSEYGRLSPNLPSKMTGLGLPLFYLGIGPAYPAVYPLVAAALGRFAFVQMRKHDIEYAIAYWLTILMMTCLLPLHGPDLLFLFSIILVLPFQDLICSTCAAIYIAAVWRPAQMFQFALRATDVRWTNGVWGIASLFLAVSLWRTIVACAERRYVHQTSEGNAQD